MAWSRVDKKSMAWAKNGYSTKRQAESDSLLVVAKFPDEIGKIAVKRGGWWWREKA